MSAIDCERVSLPGGRFLFGLVVFLVEADTFWLAKRSEKKRRGFLAGLASRGWRVCVGVGAHGVGLF